MLIIISSHNFWSWDPKPFTRMLALSFGEGEADAG